MSITVKGLDKLIQNVELMASPKMKKNFKLWLEALGMEFLDIVQDEIIRTKTVDTRLLLNSFTRDDDNNIWKLKVSGNVIELKAGSKVEYASFANSGHNQEKRFVPGYWRSNGKFIYDPSANSGMLLSVKWVEGSHYWDNSKKIFEKIFSKSLEKKLELWLKKKF